MKDGQIFHVLNFGQGNMSSYASQISREDRWKVILYVRSLQTEEARKTAALAATAAAAKAAPAPPAGPTK
jgi:mono/diheme cytochrome c family protein